MLKNNKKVVVAGLIFMESANSPFTYWIIPDLPGILDREDVRLDIFAEAYHFCSEEAIHVLLRHRPEWSASEDPSRGYYINLPYFAEEENENKGKEEEKARKRAKREKRGVKHLSVSLGEILKEKGFA